MKKLIWFCMSTLLVSSIGCCTAVEAAGRNRYRRVDSNSYRCQSNQCGVRQSVVHRERTVTTNYQEWAEDEARMMAARGTCGHVRGALPGTFVGVGCGSTCQGDGTLVAEAHYAGRTVRVWAR